MESSIENTVTGTLYTIDGKKLCDVTDVNFIDDINFFENEDIIIKCTCCGTKRKILQQRWNNMNGPSEYEKWFLCRSCDNLTLFREAKYL